MMKWKEFGRKQSWPDLRHCFGVFKEGMRKSAKTIRVADGLADI
jgi:hypothetical protein